MFNKLSNKILKEKADEAIDRLINHQDLGVIQEWRGEHLAPMIQLKDFVIQETEKLQIKPVFVSARLKMITTIIDKIKTGRHKKLSTMQDLGGVRIVFDNHEDLYLFYNELSKSKVFKILRTKDYIKEPKETGYRGIHIVYDIDRCNIELQLRTEGQHIWATTVETVGWHLKQDLKSGKGDLKWVQFFQETADIFCAKICCHNIQYIQSFTINNANVVEYLKSIHKDCYLSDFEQRDINERATLVSAEESICHSLGSCIVRKYWYSKGVLPKQEDSLFEERIKQLFDNSKCILLTTDFASMELLPYDDGFLENSVISFDSVTSGNLSYIQKEEEYFHNIKKIFPMFHNNYQDCCSLLLYVSDITKLEDAYPCFFSQTKQFTDYLDGLKGE